MTDAERKALIPGERVMVMGNHGASPHTVTQAPGENEDSGNWYVCVGRYAVALDRVTGYADPTEIVFVVGADGDHVCELKDQRAVLERMGIYTKPSDWLSEGEALNAIEEITRAGYRVVFEPGKAVEPPTVNNEVV